MLSRLAQRSHPEKLAGDQNVWCEVFLGNAAGRAREALAVPKLVPESGFPNLVKGALASGDEDAAVQLESVPVSPGHDGLERGQRSRQWLLVGVRLGLLELRESREQGALRRVAGGSPDRAHRCRERRPGVGGRAVAMAAYATLVAACAVPAGSK